MAVLWEGQGNSEGKLDLREKEQSWDLIVEHRYTKEKARFALGCQDQEQGENTDKTNVRQKKTKRIQGGNDPWLLSEANSKLYAGGNYNLGSQDFQKLQSIKCCLIK